MSPIALLCTAILGVLVFGLGMAVSAQRLREKRLQGHSDDPGNLLHRLVRAHGNAAEYAPILAVVFLALGTYGQRPLFTGLMIGATAARVLHAAGLLAGPSMAKANPLRFLGALGTYGFGSALAVVLAYHAWQPL